MCGRYVNKNTIDDLIDFFGLDHSIDISSQHNPSYNICPTQYSPVLFKSMGSLKIEDMSWGLITSWAKDISFASKLINARIETIKQKPSFKNLVKKNRCIVIANGYYEWIKTSEGKQPVYIHSKDRVILMAGLWTSWDEVNSFTIITKSSEGILKKIHHRMPLLINYSDMNTYLNSNIDFSDSFKFYDPGFQYHKVSKKVNYHKNNDLSCIKTID
tara:strand:- start:4 stop:648 length:645 start_codon:yes stop_codon:yes gene_type:complete